MHFVPIHFKPLNDITLAEMLFREYIFPHKYNFPCFIHWANVSSWDYLCHAYHLGWALIAVQLVSYLIPKAHFTDFFLGPLTVYVT